MDEWKKIASAFGIEPEGALSKELMEIALDNLGDEFLVRLENAAERGRRRASTAQRGKPAGANVRASGWRYRASNPFDIAVKARAATNIRLAVPEGHAASRPPFQLVELAVIEASQGRCRLLEGLDKVFIEFWDEVHPAVLRLSGRLFDLQPVVGNPDIWEIAGLSVEAADRITERLGQEAEACDLSWEGG
jgi:hypothetical protein